MARPLQRAEEMRDQNRVRESGRAGWALVWLLGVPLPVLLLVYLLTRC